MNFSEDQYRQAQEQMKHMTPEQMKGQTSAFNSMSDEQLKAMSQAQGLNIDPAMFRQASQMMQNMNPEQLDQMRRMSSNMGYNQFKDKQPPTNNYNNNNNSQNQSTSNSNLQSKAPISNNTSSSGSSYKYPQFENINNLKLKGNEFFKKQDFESAKGKYQEGIFEVEEVRMKAQYKSYSQELKNEVQSLEIALRMNYANILAKQDEFELVQDQAKEVLKIDQENGKGNFRMGQSLFKMEKFEKSREYIEKAAQIMKSDQNVQQLYKELKEKLGIKEEEKKEQDIQEEEIKEKKQNNKQQSDEQTKQSFDDGVEIKQEKEETKSQYNSTSSNSYTQPPPSYYNQNMPQDKAQQAKMAQDQLKNMSSDQLEFMTNQMKNMDRETLRQQMKAQTGMDMSDEQIDMYKNMMTPETLKMMQNMDPDMINQMKGQAGNMGNQQAGGFDPSTMNQGDALKKMQENPEMIKMAMEQMKKNPEMFKSMAKSMGGPMAGFLEKSSPEDMEKMMNMMQKAAPLIQYGMKIFGFCKKNKYYLMGMMGLLVVYWFF